MSELQIGKVLLDLALLFALTVLGAGVCSRLRLPSILGALFVAMAMHYTPFGARLLASELYSTFTFLAQLGVLFLLFFIGLQVDLQEMRHMSSEIVWLTVFNTMIPFLLGVVVMRAWGYGWLLAFVIGLTRMPTAEAVVVPILDEFQLLRTRVGQFIVGVGTLDDVIEVFLVALVSIWIGEQGGEVATSAVGQVGTVTVGLLVFVGLTWVCARWLIPLARRWIPRDAHHLMLLAMVVLCGLGGFAASIDLGIVVGAIVAGMLMRPAFNGHDVAGESAMQAVRIVSYGFLGLVFFFWVGLSTDLVGMLQQPVLASLLFLATFVGKPMGVFIMGLRGKLTFREVWAIGIGLNAQLTTEIIVAQLLLSAGLIDVGLFTALVAASSLTTVSVPLLLTFLLRRWGTSLRAVPHPLQPEEIRDAG